MRQLSVICLYYTYYIIYFYIIYISDRGEDCMQKHLWEHFQLLGHTGFLQDTYVTFIDKTDPRAPTKREDYWIHILKTKAPMGLHVEDGC